MNLLFSWAFTTHGNIIPVVQNIDVPTVDAYTPSDLTTRSHNIRVPTTHHRQVELCQLGLFCASTHLPQAKSVSSILSSKKDQHMLSPCSDDPRWSAWWSFDDPSELMQLANIEFLNLQGVQGFPRKRRKNVYYVPTKGGLPLSVGLSIQRTSEASR